MARHLKTGRTPEQTTAEAKKVRDIVTGIIEDIESRGETALREISEKFDKWNPPSFRLSEQEIEGCLVPALPAEHRRHQVRASPGAQLRPGAALRR